MRESTRGTAHRVRFVQSDDARRTAFSVNRVMARMSLDNKNRHKHLIENKVINKVSMRLEPPRIGAHHQVPTKSMWHGASAQSARRTCNLRHA